MNLSVERGIVILKVVINDVQGSNMAVINEIRTKDGVSEEEYREKLLSSLGECIDLLEIVAKNKKCTSIVCPPGSVDELEDFLAKRGFYYTKTNHNDKTILSGFVKPIAGRK